MKSAQSFVEKVGRSDKLSEFKRVTVIGGHLSN